MRRSLRLLLDGEEGIEVIAEADDLAAVTRNVHAHEPHVLVLDLSMPDGSSIEAIGRLREQAPDTQIVVMTMEDNPVFAQRAFAAGAVGFVVKDLADNELPQAIRAAARGEEYISPRIAARLDALQRSMTDDALSPREVEVLRLIALGHTSVEIARKLHLSPRTVETHRARIHGKLGLATRAELVRYALRRGLLGPLTGPACVPRSVWQTRPQQRALLAGVDAQRPPGETHPLAHPRKPEALARESGSKAATVVLHLDQQLPVGFRDRDTHPVGAGVLGDVRERLLHESVDGGLELLTEARLRLGAGERELAVDLESALLAMAVKERLDRRAQPQLVQGGRAQLGDDRAQVGDLPLDMLHGLVHRRLSPPKVIASPRGGEQHAQAPETLQGLVVQLPCPAPPLGIRGGQRTA